MKKTGKKLLSAVLVLSMAISLITISASANPSTGELVDEVGDFISLEFNYDTDTVIEKSQYFVKDGGDITTTNTQIMVNNSYTGNTESANQVLAANKYLELGTVANRGRFQVCDWAMTTATGRYFTEFKFKMDSVTSINHLFMAYLNSNAVVPGGYYSSAGVDVAVTSNGSNYVFKAGNTSTNWVVSDGVWYNLKVDIDIPGRKYDLYVNSALIAKDIAFTGGASFDGVDYFTYLDNNNITFPNKFNNIFDYDNYVSGAKVCLDDIRVYKEPTGVITYAADDFSGYSSDVAYDGSVYRPSFAGLVTGRADRQTGFIIDSANGYVTTTGGGNMQLEATKSGSYDYKNGAYSVEFKLIPKSDNVGEILTIADRWATHTGLRVCFTGKYINIKHGIENLDLNKNKPWDYGSTSVGPYENDTTYNIRVLVDANRTYVQNVTKTDGTTVTYNRPGVCDVYINDELVAGNVPFGYNTDKASNSIPAFQLYLRSGGAAIIDDLRVYSDEREEVLSRLNGDIAAMFSDGIVANETAVTLPSTYSLGEGRRTYNIEWTSSDNNIINPETGAVNRNKLGDVSLTAKIYYTGEENYGITRTYDLSVANYVIDAVTFTDAESKVAEAPTNGGKLAKVSVKKYVDIGANLFAAVYESDEMKTCGFVPNVTTGEHILDVNVTAESKIVFFVWSNDGAIKPVMIPYEVH